MNAETGISNASFDPLKTLRKYRLLPPYGTTPGIGILLAIRRVGTIQRSDDVYIEDE